MSAFLRQMFEAHTEMAALLVSLAKRGGSTRYPRRQDRSDGDVVMSDLAATISDLGAATTRVVGQRSGKRAS